MSYHFELSADRPILSNTLEAPFDGEEIPAITAEMAAWLDKLDHRVYYVINLNRMEFKLSDITRGAYVAALGSRTPLHHRNIIETIVITDNALVTMIVRGLDSPLFGFLKVRTLPTLDEALAYIDAQVAAALGQP